MPRRRRKPSVTPAQLEDIVRAITTPRLMEFEVIVKLGRTVLENGGVCWDRIKTYYRFGQRDADMKADDERRQNPSATVIVRAIE